MCKFRRLKRIAAVLIAIMGWYHVAPGAAAASVSPPQSVRAADAAAVQKVLETTIARQILVDYGASPEEVERLLTRISDAELHELASQTERLAAGAGDGAVVVLLVIAVVLLILLLMGKRIAIR